MLVKLINYPAPIKWVPSWLLSVIVSPPLSKNGNHGISIMPIQQVRIQPITAGANFGSYSLTERMKASFKSFKEQYGGNVFIVFSLDGEIANKEVIEQIKVEINRLS